MPRRARLDVPGTWHHVMNRDLARRTVLETREDVRFLLSRIARCVRSGRIEYGVRNQVPFHGLSGERLCSP